MLCQFVIDCVLRKCVGCSVVKCVICCSRQVQPKHVKEAFRLLNKSIVRVETPDVNLDQDQEMEEEEGENGTQPLVLLPLYSRYLHVLKPLRLSAGRDVPNGANGINGLVNEHADRMNGHSDGTNRGANGVEGLADVVSGHSDSGPKPPLRLTFPEYRRISNLLVLHLRRAEEGKAPETHTFYMWTVCYAVVNCLPVCAAEEEEELKKSAVINWYLKEMESEIDSEEELIHKKSLIEKVLHRLVHYVRTHEHTHCSVESE